jgi:hypothetical protein
MIAVAAGMCNIPKVRTSGIVHVAGLHVGVRAVVGAAERWQTFLLLQKRVIVITGCYCRQQPFILLGVGVLLEYALWQ